MNSTQPDKSTKKLLISQFVDLAFRIILAAHPIGLALLVFSRVRTHFRSHTSTTGESAKKVEGVVDIAGIKEWETPVDTRILIVRSIEIRQSRQIIESTQVILMPLPPQSRLVPQIWESQMAACRAGAQNYPDRVGLEMPVILNPQHREGSHEVLTPHEESL